MQINISTRHGQLGKASREKIAAKVEKILRFNDRVSAIDVTVDLKSSDAPSVELRVSVEKSEDFVATDQEGSLIAAVDACIHKVEQQLRKHKQKVVDHRKPGLRTLAAEVDVDVDDVADEEARS